VNLQRFAPPARLLKRQGYKKRNKKKGEKRAMKLKKNRKLLVAMAIVLALVIGASATFAWVTSRTQLANEFTNEGFAASDGLIAIEEETVFKFEIGATTPKTVSVLNTGSTGMLARVSFEEMIKLLGNNGTITYTSSNTAASDAVEAVPFDISTVASWAEIDAADITWTGTAPTGIAIYAANPDSEAPQFAVVYTDGGGKQWLAKLGDGAVYTKATGKITGATVEYGYYTKGTAEFNSWNLKNNYDWSKLSLITGLAAAPYTASTGTTPLAADVRKSSVNPTEVGLVYDAAFSATMTGNTDTWVYWNGYFYWMKVIPGGGYTENLLNGVSLDGNADQKKWQKYEYALVICVEGLQATVEALTDDTATGNAAGWQLDPTDDAALIAALTTAINA